MAKKKKTKKDQNKIIARIIIGIVIVVVMLVAAFRLGAVGIFLSNILKYICGEFYLFTVISLLAIGIYYIFFQNKFYIGPKVISGIIILNLAIILISALNFTKGIVGMEVFSEYLNFDPQILVDNSLHYGGGLLGAFLYALVSSLFDTTGTIIVIAALIIIGLVLVVPLSVFINLYNDAINVSKDVNHKHKINKLKKEEAKRQKIEKMAKEENERLKEENFKFIDIDDKEVNAKEDSHNNSIFIDVNQNDTKSKEDINIITNQETKKEDSQKSDAPRVLKEDCTIDYKLPPINVFDNVTQSKSGNINKTSAELKGKKVIEILNNFGIEAELINTHIGPSVTKFEIKPDSSVKVSKILNISDNIKMELAARDIRIEAPIPGRNAVGIEIPNVEPTPVRMQELVKNLPANKQDKKLLFFLGKDLMGKVVTCEIDKMPHLLIAGATGSGKSVCINAIIASLLYRTNPNDVKLVLVDPKKVEFTPYHDVPHLLWPVITDATMANNMLKKVVVMMEGRFDVFAEVGVRNIQSYNDAVDNFNKTNSDPSKAMTKMPYIVVIIDELADLMMIAGKEVEASIQRITQLARASGIHLIVATQRPSTDVITGIIKSNIPSRISFSVASSIDSRTILDQTGAERLLGNGDMLYFPQGETSPIRLQGVYVTDNEVKNITTYCKKQAKPNYDDSYFEFLNIANHSNLSDKGNKENDSLYEEVKEYVIDAQKASTSLLQRRFGIGYNRAAGLIETLEDNGIIGPQNGSKPREVFVKKETQED